jgi:hypothetical protein
MDIELKRIKKLTAFMIKSGLSRLKSGDIEINLAPHILHKAELSPLNSDGAIQASPQTPTITEEDILFWSSPGLNIASESETI